MGTVPWEVGGRSEEKWSGLILIHYSYLIYFYTQNILCPRFNASFYYFLKFPSPSVWALIIKADESYNRIKPIKQIKWCIFSHKSKEQSSNSGNNISKDWKFEYIIYYRSAVIPQRNRQQQPWCSLNWAFTTVLH